MARHRQILLPARLAFVAIASLIVCPVAAQAEERQERSRIAPLGQGIPDVLLLLKEEETVSIASRYEQPISQAPSNVYVITDEDIRPFRRDRSADGARPHSRSGRHAGDGSGLQRGRAGETTS